MEIPRSWGEGPGIAAFFLEYHVAFFISSQGLSSSNNLKVRERERLVLVKHDTPSSELHLAHQTSGSTSGSTRSSTVSLSLKSGESKRERLPSYLKEACVQSIPRGLVVRLVSCWSPIPGFDPRFFWGKKPDFFLRRLPF